MVVRYRNKKSAMENVADSHSCLKFHRDSLQQVVDIIDGVNLNRIICMGEYYHARFHINLEIGFKFMRTSRAVFNDAFLVKEEECADIETTLSLKSPSTLNLQPHSFVAASTETNVTCSGQCDTHTHTHTRCRESSTNLQNMWQLINVLFF